MQPKPNRKFSFGWFRLFQNRNSLFNFIVRTRNYVNGSYRSDAPRRRRARVNRRFDRADLSAHDRRHQSRINSFVTDQRDIRRL